MPSTAGSAPRPDGRRRAERDPGLRDAGVGVDDRAAQSPAGPARARAGGRARRHGLHGGRAGEPRRYAPVHATRWSRCSGSRASGRARWEYRTSSSSAGSPVDRPRDGELRRGSVPVGADVRFRPGRGAAGASPGAEARGRAALAVWAEPERNPWATIPTRALVELGQCEPPDPSAPGMFALADAERLRGLLEDAGFIEVVVERGGAVASGSRASEEYLEGTLDLSQPFAEVRDAADRRSSGPRSRRGSRSWPSRSPARTGRCGSRRARSAPPQAPSRADAATLRRHVLRRRRRPPAPRRQDRRDHRVRLPGPRPLAQPQGLRGRRGRRAAAGLGQRREGARARPARRSIPPTPPPRATS